MRRALAVSLILASMLGAAPARADQKEWILSLQPGFSFMKIDDRTAWGGGGGVDASYGVLDSLAVRVTGAASGQSLPETRDPKTMKLTAAGGAVTTWYAGVGVTYAIDVVRLVPYFDLSVGILGTVQPTIAANGTVVSKLSNDFGMEIGIGVDYIVNRRISLGLVARYHAYLTNISSIPVYLYAGPRVAIHWGG